VNKEIFLDLTFCGVEAVNKTYYSSKVLEKCIFTYRVHNIIMLRK